MSSNPTDRQKKQPRAKCKQWEDMSSAERKAWCRYFQGKGAKPKDAPIKFAD